MNDAFLIIEDYFSADRPQPLEVVGAMLLSFTLNLFVANLYRSTYKGTRYSQDFVQALIMIGTITTILIMVVSGNAGIAFGMFAAFSMIRFRRNLGQARDLGFVFFAMAVGMVLGLTLAKSFLAGEFELLSRLASGGGYLGKMAGGGGKKKKG